MGLRLMVGWVQEKGGCHNLQYGDYEQGHFAADLTKLQTKGLQL